MLNYNKFGGELSLTGPDIQCTRGLFEPYSPYRDQKMEEYEMDNRCDVSSEKGRL